jgi:hypothetical protein
MTNSVLPPPDSVVLPEPFSHGYLYGSSSHVFGDGFPYTPEEQAAAHAGTLQPIDYTDVNHTFAFGTGGVISTANDLATFFKAYVGGGLLDPEYQALLINSLQLEHADKPGVYYGYGLSALRWADNSIDFHGGETAGFNLFAGYDRTNQLAIVVWRRGRAHPRMRDEHGKASQAPQNVQNPFEAWCSSPDGSSQPRAMMTASTAIATAGASSSGNASPNRTTAAMRTTRAVASMASRRDASRSRSVESMAVGVAVADVASVASGSTVVGVVMVSSFGSSRGGVPGTSTVARRRFRRRRSTGPPAG